MPFGYILYSFAKKSKGKRLKRRRKKRLVFTKELLYLPPVQCYNFCVRIYV